MKDRIPKSFHIQYQAVGYGGQVGFTKMDATPIRWIKAAAFSSS